MIVRCLIVFAMLLLLRSVGAQADPQLPFPAPSFPDSVISLDRIHRVGIKKVGYQVRGGDHVTESVPVTPSVHYDVLPLSSPFWQRPFVLSLQWKTSELPP